MRSGEKTNNEEWNCQIKKKSVPCRKENLQLLKNIESRHHQTSGDE